MVTGIGNYGVDLIGLAKSAEEAGGLTNQNSAEAQGMHNSLGDTVEISEEAYALLESKMEEYKGKISEDLSEDQKDELKGLLSDAFGVSEDEIDEIAQKIAQGPPPKGERRPADHEESEGSKPHGDSEASSEKSASGAGAGASGSAGGAGGTSSSSDDDLIDQLEREIEKLEKEIEKLRGKALNDEEAKAELQVKQVDLSTKQTELTELESEQTQV